MPNNELKLFKYIIKAQLVEPSDKDYEEIETAASGFFIASNAPFVDGKPKMLFLTAWMAHEGRNLNGDAFISEELRQRVKEGLFTPPFAGMIDLDHDFNPRGYWYKSTYAFDENAQKWGILTTGAVWAWRYPELADFVTQQMADQGFVYVSMSALAEANEVVLNYSGFEGQPTHILHNPIFFTSAILTVPPGDFDAKVISVAEAKEGTTIQTLIFPKAHWKNEEEASKWAKKAGFKTDDYRTTASSFRYRQVDPSKFDQKSFRTICLTGAKRDEPANPSCKVKAVIGKLKGGN